MSTFVDILLPEKDVRVLERVLRDCIVPHCTNDEERAENKKVLDDFYITLVELVKSLDLEE